MIPGISTWIHIIYVANAHTWIHAKRRFWSLSIIVSGYVHHLFQVPNNYKYAACQVMCHAPRQTPFFWGYLHDLRLQASSNPYETLLGWTMFQTVLGTWLFQSFQHFQGPSGSGPCHQIFGGQQPGWAKTIVIQEESAKFGGKSRRCTFLCMPGLVSWNIKCPMMKF